MTCALGIFVIIPLARSVDAAGNTTAMTDPNGTLIGLGYDDTNRLTTVTNGSSTIANYQYNGEGQRVWRTFTQPTAGQVATVYDPNGTGNLYGEYFPDEHREFVYLDGIVVASATDAGMGVPGINYLYADHLGTLRAAVDPSGATNYTWPWLNNAFGDQPQNGTVAFYTRFPGQYFDAETGLNYNVNRDYDSSTGRYIESDPMGLAGGLNSYATVSNSPLNRIDPDGLRDIFVGGFGDASSGIVQSYYNSYHQNNPDSAYYSWTDLNGILQDIANTPAGDPINLIGHSYGGDTAATAARESCRKVNLLITIDPVSRFHNFNMQAIANAVGIWVDVDAEGNNPFQPSNFIAGMGDAWDGAPNGIANSYIQDNGVNHEDFQSMMNASGPGVNSPAQVLSGAPTVNAPFLPGR